MNCFLLGKFLFNLKLRKKRENSKLIYPPSNNIICFSCLQKRNCIKYDLVFAFNDIFLLYIKLSQQSQWIRHFGYVQTKSSQFRRLAWTTKIRWIFFGGNPKSTFKDGYDWSIYFIFTERDTSFRLCYGAKLCKLW